MKMNMMLLVNNEVAKRSNRIHEQITLEEIFIEL